MRLKGICTIEWLENSEVIKTYTQENLIPDNTWVAILAWDGSGTGGIFTGTHGLVMGNLRISISQDTRDPVASIYLIDDVIGTGRVASGITSPIWVDEVEPPFGTVINLIDDVGVQRTFNSVALTALNSGNIQDIDQVNSLCMAKARPTLYSRNWADATIELLNSAFR
ncbi:MAG: hypothetical protein HC908_08965 [Calothrix sp. SM1_7_51]|nr:hypothetical protein [Calothrix sp. SM1_7_51]